MPELPDYLADGFREVLSFDAMTGAEIKHRDEKVERLLALVSDALDDASGIWFRNSRLAVDHEWRNGADLRVNMEASGDIESIDFDGEGVVGELFWAKP